MYHPSQSEFIIVEPQTSTTNTPNKIISLPHSLAVAFRMKACHFTLLRFIRVYSPTLNRSHTQTRSQCVHSWQGMSRLFGGLVDRRDRGTSEQSGRHTEKVAHDTASLNTSWHQLKVIPWVFTWGLS